MRQFTIDPEFRDKIPPMSLDEFSKLEENILTDGEVREPLVVWRNTIIDGHHRWAIIQKHPEIPYKVKQMEFPDKWAAIVWMCRNQLGRRNITDEQKTVLIGEAYRAQKLSVGNHAQHDTDGKYLSRQNDDLGAKQIIRTKDVIAQKFNVAGSTVERAECFANGLDAAEKVSPGIREAVLSGEVKAPKALIADIRNVPEEVRPKVVEAIRDGKTADAKVIVQKSLPKKEPKPVEAEQPPFSAGELRELIDAAAKTLDAALKQHLVLVHRDVLDTEDGRKEATEGIQNVISIAEKYLDMIRRIKENGENN